MAKKGTDYTVSEIVYTSESLPVRASLYAPKPGKRPVPGVLLCPARARDIKGLEFISTALARSGFVVLATTYRGECFDKDDIDAVNGISYLSSLPQVDSNYLGIVGHSRGGLAALLAAAIDPRIKSVVALAPVTDMAQLVNGLRGLSPLRYAGMVEAVGGTPEEVPDRYEHMNAIAKAPQIRVPVLLVHGTLDANVPVEHSQRMHEALIAAGNPNVRLELIPDMAHYFDVTYYGYQFDRIAQLVRSWFEETLRPKV